MADLHARQRSSHPQFSPGMPFDPNELSHRLLYVLEERSIRMLAGFKAELELLKAGSTGSSSRPLQDKSGLISELLGEPRTNLNARHQQGTHHHLSTGYTSSRRGSRYGRLLDQTDFYEQEVMQRLPKPVSDTSQRRQSGFLPKEHYESRPRSQNQPEYSRQAPLEGPHEPSQLRPRRPSQYRPSLDRLKRVSTLVTTGRKDRSPTRTATEPTTMEPASDGKRARRTSWFDRLRTSSG